MSDTDFETMYAEWLEAHSTKGPTSPATGCPGNPIVPRAPKPDDVRAWWQEKHRPPLAERIAEAVIKTWIGWRDDEPPIVMDADVTQAAIAAVQRVLDEEGERA